jgi:flagellar biosynthesis protein FlhF
MRIKRYEAPSIPRAMAQVKREMGGEAVILQVKKKKKFGPFFFPRQEIVEVVAGTNMNVPEQYQAAGEPETPGRRTSPADDPATLNRQLRLKDMQNELDRLKSALSRIMAERNIKITPQFKGRAGLLYQSLTERGVKGELAQRIIYLLKEAKSELESEGLGTNRLLLDHFAKKLQGLFAIGGQIRAKGREQRVITLVGPTGEGKTTTIAKLAANYALVMGKKVALISADTYRIAAPEQLKIYGEIIGVPVAIVYTPMELAKTLEELKDKELVFVDTAGRSPANNLHLSELRAYLNVCHPAEIHLVLSSTKKSDDMQFALEKCQGIDLRSVIFTKLDETQSLDSVMNFTYAAKKPLSYFGVGQNVPDDIELASTDRFVQFILQGLRNDGSGAALA